MDSFTRAYLHAAAFTEDPDPGQGEYPEPNHGELSPEFCARAAIDCARFQEAAGDLITEDPDHAGRDFWYTRNGHGCGFWDGDWPEAAGETLTALAETFGEEYGPVFVLCDAEAEADAEDPEGLTCCRKRGHQGAHSDDREGYRKDWTIEGADS